MPAAGASSVVASTAALASLTLREAWFTAALAWATATASTVGDGFWAVAGGFLAWSSFCWAAARLAWAISSATLALAGSTVARTWPSLTLSPAFTLTAVRTPPFVKLRSREVAGCTVPVADTVCDTVPSVADTSRVAVLAVEPPEESMAP